MPTDKEKIKTIKIPALYDHHSHTSLYAAFPKNVTFWDVMEKSKAEDIIAGLPPDKLTLIPGWNQNNFTFTDKELAAMPPVIIAYYTLHKMVMSPAAEAIVRESHPEIAANYKNQEWYEKNIAEILSFLGTIIAITDTEVHDHLQNIENEGVLHVEDMLLVDEKAFRIINKSPMSGRVTFWAGPGLYEKLPPDIQKRIKGIKIWTDGEFTLKTSAMFKPYLGGTDKGLLCYEDAALLGLIKKFGGQNKALALHAIGDRAVSQILKVLKALRSEGIRLPEIRIEHALFISIEQARDAKDLGVILSMQPNFSSDSISFASMLPEGYPKKNNPFRMLIDEVGFVPGKNLVFGSDGMPHGVETALQSALFPPEEGQKLTLEEFVQGYTLPDEKVELAIEIDYVDKRVNLLTVKRPTKL